MSATHRVHVVEASPSTAKLRITIAHEDETGIPLFRTAMAAMMFESLDAAEEAGHKVSSVAKKLFTDEPEAEDAAKILASVTLLAVESGKVKAQNPAQGLRFARKGRTKCAVLVEVKAAKTGLFGHLAEGLEWDAAPLFPEMEEEWPTDEDE